MFLEAKLLQGVAGEHRKASAGEGNDPLPTSSFMKEIYERTEALGRLADLRQAYLAGAGALLLKIRHANGDPACAWPGREELTKLLEVGFPIPWEDLLAKSDQYRGELIKIATSLNQIQRFWESRDFTAWISGTEIESSMIFQDEVMLIIKVASGKCNCEACRGRS